jgi:hypothetical protein
MVNAGLWGSVVVWIPPVLIMASGIAKLVEVAPIVESLTKLGVGRYRQLLGVMELVFAAKKKPLEWAVAPRQTEVGVCFAC